MNIEKSIILILVLFLAVSSYSNPVGEKIMKSSTEIMYATFAENREQLQHVYYLAESIRKFGGATKDAPIMVLVPDFIDIPVEMIESMFAGLDVEVKVSHTPKEASWFYFAPKVFASGVAEKVAEERKIKVLVWMDEDTIILREPSAFRLAPDIVLGYRPVMHNRSGSLYEETPGAFWQRVYYKLQLKEEQLFPMITPADKERIRAYFNAGLVVVRPERGVLRKWGDDFVTLYQDSILTQKCREEVKWRIFIHQAGLVGAVLNSLKREQMTELPPEYNYPLFFDQMYGAKGKFESIDNVVTLRYDVYFRDPAPDWSDKLTGEPEKIKWLKERLGNKKEE